MTPNFNTYKVGEFYQEFLHPNNLIRVDYNGTAWMLTIGFPGITREEVSELQTGDMRATFTVIDDSLFLLTKIGAFDWFDFPYEPRLYLPDDAASFYPKFEPGIGAALVLLITDTSCGKLCGMRVMGLGNRFSNNLHGTCKEICKKGPVSPEENTMKVEKVYSEYPTASDLVKTVDIGNVYLLMKHGL